MSNKKILLIGGKGFIGSHLNGRLLELGHDVKVIDRGDELDFEGIDVIFHLAGAINLRRGGDSGVERARNICDLAKEHGVKKIVFFSSGGAIYANPESGYAKANLEIEEIIKESGLDYIILRLSNVYGPHQWEEGLIPRLINNRSLKILADGNQTRDFIYIDDVVEASIIAMNKKGTYNVGSGETHSLNEVVDIIKEYKEIEIEYIGGKDVNAEALDIEKTKEDFNWEPKVNLKEGLKKIIDYYQDE